MAQEEIETLKLKIKILQQNAHNKSEADRVVIEALKQRIPKTPSDWQKGFYRSIQKIREGNKNG
jgi:hypothetical protein